MEVEVSRLSEAQGELGTRLTRLKVNVPFAYWLWCQKRMKKLVNSSESYSKDAWLMSFTELRRKARKAEFSWASALYCFRQLKEQKPRPPVSPKNDKEQIDLKNRQQHQVTEQSAQALHLVANFNQKRQLYAFFCESQPLLTFWSHGLPVRCPLCRAENPLRGATNDNSQG